MKPYAEMDAVERAEWLVSMRERLRVAQSITSVCFTRNMGVENLTPTELHRAVDTFEQDEMAAVHNS